MLLVSIGKHARLAFLVDVCCDVSPAGQLNVRRKDLAFVFALLLWLICPSRFVCFLWRQVFPALKRRVVSAAAQYCTAAAFVRHSGVCPQAHVLPAVPAQDLTRNASHMHEPCLLWTVYQQLGFNSFVLPNCTVYAGVALLACRALGAFYPWGCQPLSRSADALCGLLYQRAFGSFLFELCVVSANNMITDGVILHLLNAVVAAYSSTRLQVRLLAWSKPARFICTGVQLCCTTRLNL
jgi:hypothetical protein